MADSTSNETRNSSWDGTSGSGLKHTTPKPPVEGKLAPEIRGTVTSPIRAEEISTQRQIHRAPLPDRSQWPRKAVTGEKPEGQGQH